MQFAKSLGMFSPLVLVWLLAISLPVLSPLVSAASITFTGEDSTGRTVHFTGNGEVGDIHVGAGESVSQEFPEGWTGNFYSVCDGCDDEPGMLGEVAFDGFEGKTFYDVSAIVDPDDHSGVHRFSPSGGDGETAGCDTFPCPDNAYYAPDDVQTKVTDSKDFVVSLSGGGGGGGTAGYDSDDDESVADSDDAAPAEFDGAGDDTESSVGDADSNDGDAGLSDDEGSVVSDGDFGSDGASDSGDSEDDAASDAGSDDDAASDAGSDDDGGELERRRTRAIKRPAGIVTRGRSGTAKGSLGFVKRRMAGPKLKRNTTVMTMVPVPAAPVSASDPKVKST